ncbi:MAG: hypothetical protein ACRDUA_09095 [Micromonosporaceae bacterium]
MPSEAEELAAAVARLVGQIQHWTPSRWGAASGVSGRSRADLVHALVQHLADLAAAAEGQAARTVPRLDNDLALPDQLLVVTRDLVRTAPSGTPLASATQAVAQTRTGLWGG